MRGPTDIVPRREWVLVLDEPRPEKVGSLYLPGEETHEEKMMEGAGTVMVLGPGLKKGVLGLEVGQRVMYRSFLKHGNPIEHGETWEDGTKKSYFLMAIDDILAVIPQGLSVGVYGGRPMVKEKE